MRQTSTKQSSTVIYNDEDKDNYMGLSLLCGKIFRTVKYQYFGWFEEPTIKIDVLECLQAQKDLKIQKGSALSLRSKFVRKKCSVFFFGSMKFVRKNFPHTQISIFLMV